MMNIVPNLEFGQIAQANTMQESSPLRVVVLQNRNSRLDLGKRKVSL